MAETVSSPLSLNARSISSGYVYGGFLEAGSVSKDTGSYSGSSNVTFTFTSSSNLKFRSQARLPQSSSSFCRAGDLLRRHLAPSTRVLLADMTAEWQGGHGCTEWWCIWIWNARGVRIPSCQDALSPWPRVAQVARVHLLRRVRSRLHLYLQCLCLNRDFIVLFGI